MPPINTIVVQTLLLPPDRRDETTLAQAQRLLGKALQPVEEALEGKDYIIGDFSAADVMLGHSCIMSNRLGVVTDDMPNLKAYAEQLLARRRVRRRLLLNAALATIPMMVAAGALLPGFGVAVLVLHVGLSPGYPGICRVDGSRYAAARRCLTRSGRDRYRCQPGSATSSS